MSDRSPIEVLGAIIDEVDGLRKTDAKSHLPNALMREARALLDTTSPTSAIGSKLSGTYELAGRTIDYVFDCGIKRCDLLIVCSDGGFIALRSDGSDEDAGISTCYSFNGKPESLADYLEPDGLEECGLITSTQCEYMKAEMALSEAKEDEARYELYASRARKSREEIEARMI